MMQAFTRHFNSMCTIGDYVIEYDTFNQPINGNFTPSPIASLSAIPCYKEPIIDQEARQNNQVVLTNRYSVALLGFFPQIRNVDFCQIQESIYNIIGVASDDTNTVTFLNVEIVNNIVDNVN